MASISDGTLSSTVMPVCSTCASSACESCAMASGTISTRAPHNRPVRNCQTEMSKHCDAVCAITSLAPRPSHGTLLSWLLSMPACSTMAPLGTPVEPEV
jgi:hypothetical protein